MDIHGRLIILWLIFGELLVNTLVNTRLLECIIFQCNPVIKVNYKRLKGVPMDINKMHLVLDQKRLKSCFYFPSVKI